MRKTKLKYIVLFLLLFILLSGCAPSAEELASTAAIETALAATNTPIPTLTPLPTSTSTPTPTFTPTPTPDPDPNTMIDLVALDLPDNFRVNSPDIWGVEKGAVAVGTGNKIFNIENSFVFADDNRFELVFGYTAQLTGSGDIQEIDQFLSSFKNWIEVAYDKPDVTITDISVLPGADQIGNSSAGVRIEYLSGSNRIYVEQVAFRVGDIYATVNVKNFEQSNASVSVIDIAKTYKNNIQYPIHSCELLTIKPLVDNPWPAFNYQAAGFYPRESIVVLISSEVQLAGESILIGYIDGVGDEAAVVRIVTQELPMDDLGLFGFNMDTIKVDNTGSYYGSIMQTSIEADDVVLTEEHTISIYGLYSGCQVSGSSSWQK